MVTSLAVVTGKVMGVKVRVRVSLGMQLDRGLCPSPAGAVCAMHSSEVRGAKVPQT